MPTNTSANLSFYFPTSNVDPRLQYPVFLHFAELEQLQNNQSREFNFSLDGKYALGPFSPKYLSVSTIFTTSPLSGQDQHVVDLYKTTSSTLPPILNAVEFFIVEQRTSPTDGQDGKLLLHLHSTRFTRNIISELNIHSIILDLSSSGLTGEIAPSLANLTSIQSLDVSKNSLTGPVPEFRTELPSLKFLVDNNPNLIEPSNVNVNNDINPCQVGSCKKRQKVLVPVLVSVIPSLVLLTIAVFVLWKLSQRRNQRGNIAVITSIFCISH
ncbi:hypothetical protein MRB53_012856 [Persea americana]|uniref:Uncharacterized protein n=1 Tax=Persea americana TaxID=3435 RepID=A0ACC2LYS1_PERAE|nr:hypothetical protein MRB53_012856 [Persea americana]